MATMSALAASTFNQTLTFLSQALQDDNGNVDQTRAAVAAGVSAAALLGTAYLGCSRGDLPVFERTDMPEGHWTEWTHEDIKRVVNITKTGCDSLSKSDGVTITVYSGRVKVEPSRVRKWCWQRNVTMPKGYSTNRSTLSKTTNPNANLPDGFKLVASLSNRPLVISTKPPFSASWLDMSQDEQIEMLKAAQRVAGTLGDRIESIDPKKSHFSFNCGSHANQTVPHTHLRFYNLSTEDGGVPSPKTWETIVETLTPATTGRGAAPDRANDGE